MGESIIRSLVRLGVTVAIFGAAYVFIVNPILDTTEDTINRAFDSADEAQKSLNEAFGGTNIDLSDFGEIQGIPDGALDEAIKNAPDKKTKKLLRCIDKAGSSVGELQACQQKFVE